VQASDVAGALPVQLDASTGVPSERSQVTVCVALPELAVCTHEPVRVCVKVPQPAVGVQEEYCQEALPPVQAPKPEAFQLKVQPVRTERVCEVAGFAPAPEQRPSATVVPSDCSQVTERVSVAAVEQEDDGADQAEVCQL
jgi:hypothetical protein